MIIYNCISPTHLSIVRLEKSIAKSYEFSRPIDQIRKKKFEVPAKYISIFTFSFNETSLVKIEG